MQALKIEPKRARELYPAAPAEFKAILEDSFGKEFFNQKITDRIKTFEDACEDQGIHPVTALPYTKPANDHEEAVNAIAKLFIIAKSLNEGWKADLTDTAQYKYYPWFKYSGSGLSYAYYGSWTTRTICGVRLCFKSAELAVYAGTHFLDIYKKFM